jgi:hypothetical protein
MLLYLVTKEYYKIDRFAKGGDSKTQTNPPTAVGFS